MNQREEARGHEHNERDRESNNGRDFYPGGHGFEDVRERGNREARRYGGGAEELGYGGGAGRYDQGRYDQSRDAQGSYGRDQWRQRGPWSNERSPWNERARSREASAGQGHFPRDLYGREHSSEQLFDRPPFGHVEDTHYYGTGAAGWGGPGFTGGAYAYGNGPRDQQRQIEEEYSDESAVSYEHADRPGYGMRGRYDARSGYNRGDYGGYGGSHGGYAYGSRYGYGGYRPEGSHAGGQDYRQSRTYPRGPKGYQRSDERLKEDICERLMESYHIDSSEVSVDVKGGKVGLEGSVPTRHMKHAIEDIVDACPGVTEIDNRLRVGIAVTTTPTAGTSPTAATTNPTKTR
jgi:hypothetical protein